MNTSEFNPPAASPSRLSVLADNLHLVGSRLAARGSRPRFAYMGGQGDANLGDEAILEAARQLLPTVDLVPYSFPRQEERWRRFGLSGPAYFTGAVLSGGTLINTHWFDQAQTAVDQGLPAFALGTGVGSPDVNFSEKMDITPWRPVLAKFTHIGLRGPLSQAKLEAIGITHSVVIGDLAFALTPTAIPAAPKTRKYALNSHLSGSAKYNAGTFSALQHLPFLVKELARAGWEPVPVAMHRKDISATSQALAGTEWAESPVVIQETSDQYFTALAECSFCLSTRLHAAILSACVGVLPVLLSTVDKCMDFMESMQISEFALDSGNSTPNELLERIFAAADTSEEMRAALHACALQYRTRIVDFAAEVSHV